MNEADGQDDAVRGKFWDAEVGLEDSEIQPLEASSDEINSSIIASETRLPDCIADSALRPVRSGVRLIHRPLLQCMTLPEIHSVGLKTYPTVSCSEHSPVKDLLN